MRIPFDIKYRDKIESGEYKVETRSGKTARIVCWDRVGNQLVVLVGKDEDVLTYNLDGTTGQQMQLPSDLFIVTPEQEMSEWQTIISGCLQKYGLLDCGAADRIAKESAAELLAIAKQQLLQSGELMTQEHHEKLMETLREECKKDLPRWKKCQEDSHIAFVYNCAKREDSLLYYNGYTIKLIDLEKLPGFNDEGHE